MNKEQNTRRVQSEWWETVDTGAAPRELYQDVGTCSALVTRFQWGSIIAVDL